MTLDEAIKYEDETVENYAKTLEDYEILDEEDKLLFAEAEAKWRFYFEEHRQFAEWLKDYKRLLEQKPCSDAISRKAVYEQINSWNSNGEYSYTNATYYLMKRIRDIPSVTPQPKKEAKALKNHNAYENTRILEQLFEKQNNLLATVKAWNKAIEKNGYVN